ncbi:MAG: hypothetical protein KY445_08655 [Armatimonadetes bacterium]|nr:hypothetical protein [Armatimonadota bacterium]
MKPFLNRVLGYVLGLPILVLASPLLLHYYLFPDLLQRAWRALRRGDLEKAQSLAKQALHEAQHKARDWNYGNVIHDANQILGIVALRHGDMKRAKRFLVLAGQTPGSPQLNTSGIRMVLARELAERGESEAVLEYLDAIRRFFLAPLRPNLAREDNGQRLGFVAAQRRRIEDVADEQRRQQYESWRREIEGGGVPQHRLWR